MRAASTSVAITDPLVKYQSLVASGRLYPDQSQHRFAVHLQKIYHRLKDYTPSAAYESRLLQVSNTIKTIETSRNHNHDVSRSLSIDSHPIRRNPLFSRWFSKNEPARDTRALVRVLTGHQGAVEADSPQGLFLSGEVGTGKSMLLDLLAEGLPTRGKRRWHFNTFMLYTFSQLEAFRKLNLCPQGKATGEGRGVEEYSLLWVAKSMVEQSPILFLDEFQLPDRASAKIMTNLFTAFFQLGGVLVASSNRMPEDLENAIGTSFKPLIGGGLISQVLNLTGRTRPGEMFGNTSDFATFLEVLKARCEFWHIEGRQDWRRREQTQLVDEETVTYVAVPESGRPSPVDDTQDTSNTPAENSLTAPARYTVICEGANEYLSDQHGIRWKPSSVTVYGRQLTIPRQYQGMSCWTFDEIVGTFGPADYITLASTYHTFLIDGVPILTLSKKNEARRFITLLDALYECRCKLVIRAEAGPDGLFFPDIEETTYSSCTEMKGVSGKPTSTQPPHGPAGNEANASKTIRQEDLDSEDATYSETIAEVYQEATSPFRPNVSIYSDTPDGPSFDDQDADFSLSSTSATYPSAGKPDFRNTGAFTGEDERFAYKRAASRLWEMCSERWHGRGIPLTASHDREGHAMIVGDNPDWWCPVPMEARHWEKSPPSKPRRLRLDDTRVKGDVFFGPSYELDEPRGLERFWKGGR